MLTMRVSIIVPHLNQEEYLHECLHALHNQANVDDVEKEILVVDNGSTHIPEKVCEAWGNVVLISESAAGPGPARNKGVAQATGDILAFVDADCRPETGWLAAILRSLSQPGCLIVGGDIRVSRSLSNRSNFVESYERIYGFRNREYIAKQHFSVTCNLATFPNVITHVGPFGGIDIAEDRDWGLRSWFKGYKITYVPEMIIYHPARNNFGELTQKWDRHIAHDYEMITAKRYGTLRWLARAAAIACSPLFELRTIVTSDRIEGGWARLLAFLCLTRIRLYRARRMLQVQLKGNGRAISGSWNRR